MGCVHQGEPLGLAEPTPVAFLVVSARPSTSCRPLEAEYRYPIYAQMGLLLDEMGASTGSMGRCVTEMLRGFCGNDYVDECL